MINKLVNFVLTYLTYNQYEIVRLLFMSMQVDSCWPNTFRENIQSGGGVKLLIYATNQCLPRHTFKEKPTHNFNLLRPILRTHALESKPGETTPMPNPFHLLLSSDYRSSTLPRRWECPNAVRAKPICQIWLWH